MIEEFLAMLHYWFGYAQRNNGKGKQEDIEEEIEEEDIEREE
jgi:hypothetical protein